MNRLILELMARGGMRISEVLKLTPADVIDQKLILRSPKRGKEHELVYIPQKLAEKLKWCSPIPTLLWLSVCCEGNRLSVLKKTCYQFRKPAFLLDLRVLIGTYNLTLISFY